MDLQPQSEVWKHFKNLAQERKASCKHCPKHLAFNGSTTTSLIRQLENIHKIVLIRKNDKEIHGTNEPNEDVDGTKKTKIVVQQKSLRDFLKTETLACLVARMITLDGFTAHGLCKSSFIRESFSARGYKFPKNHSDVMKLVHDHHEIIKQKFVEQTVKQHLKEGNKFSLTLDEWTSKKNRRYLNINLHECCAII